jgi:hypothetical protein
MTEHLLSMCKALISNPSSTHLLPPTTPRKKTQNTEMTVHLKKQFEKPEMTLTLHSIRVAQISFPINV